MTLRCDLEHIIVVIVLIEWFFDRVLVQFNDIICVNVLRFEMRNLLDIYGIAVNSGCDKCGLVLLYGRWYEFVIFVAHLLGRYIKLEYEKQKKRINRQ